MKTKSDDFLVLELLKANQLSSPYCMLSSQSTEFHCLILINNDGKGSLIQLNSHLAKSTFTNIEKVINWTSEKTPNLGGLDDKTSTI